VPSPSPWPRCWRPRPPAAPRGTGRPPPPTPVPPAAALPAAVPDPGAQAPGVTPPGTRGALLSVQPLESLTAAHEHGSAYLAYFAVAWNRLHHLYDTPQQAFRAPYDRTVPELLDGNHSGDSVLAALPGTPAELFTPEFLNLLRNPTGPLAEALAVADSSCDWRPEVPVRLFASSGDRDVPIANSTFCQRQVLAAGGAAVLVDVGPVDHSTTELRALPQVLAGFDQLGRN
jgi:hypothetical protein